MVALFRKFIEAERGGDREKHLYVVLMMMPYFHASGHFHYAKTSQIYLQCLSKLKKIMEESEYNNFVTKGYFTISRSDNFFTGTWTDMMIEQTANRNIKGNDGFVYRGLTDEVLITYVVTRLALSNICEELEKYCNAYIYTSEQHVDLREPRVKRNDSNTEKLYNWLNNHDPFTESEVIKSLGTGIKGNDVITCHMTKEVMAEMVGNYFQDIKLKRSSKVLSIAMVNSSIKVNNQVHFPFSRKMK